MLLNKDLESVLEGIQTGYYQVISIDKENNRVNISEPWNGKVLYALGYRTNVDELSHYLLDKIHESTTQLQSSSLPRGERLEILASLKLFKRIITQHSIEQHSRRECLQEITKASTIFKNSFKEAAPTKPDEIISEIRGFGKEKMSMKDRVEQKIHRDERTKEVLKTYKEIEIATKNMQLDPSKAETFTCSNWELDLTSADNQAVPVQKTFQAYPLPSSQKFMIHSTSLRNTIPLADTFTTKEFPASTMCLSLIHAKINFFWDRREDRAALILGVDPKEIVLTSSTDIGTPTPERKTTKSEEKRSEAYQFYHMQQRILRLGERIEQIHRASGYVTSEYLQTLEDLTKLQKKQDFEMDWEYKINHLEPRVLNEADAKFLQYTKDELKQSLKETAEAKKELNLRLNKISVLQSVSKTFSEIRNIRSRLPTSLKYLLAYYIENPDKNQSPQEFQKIFGYSGQNIIQELRKYTNFLEKLDVTNVGQPLEFPEDLLRQREKELNYNFFKHTEINIKLDTIDANTPTVEGIILTRKTIKAHTTGTPSSNSVAAKEFSRLVQFAEDNHLPIFIQDDLNQPQENLHQQQAKL